MPVATKQSSAARVIIRNVSWATYESLVKDLANSSAPRLAYDRGTLEIMSPHIGHEDANRTLASIAEIALEELDIDFRNAGSTTFKREDQERGFEPDSSFYVKNVDRVRGKKHLDMTIDPPPDLLIEVDVTSDSMNKFPLYAALGVPEVWRFEESLEIWILDQGSYTRHPASKAIPILTAKLVSEFLADSLTAKRPVLVRQTRQLLRMLHR